MQLYMDICIHTFNIFVVGGEENLLTSRRSWGNFIDSQSRSQHFIVLHVLSMSEWVSSRIYGFLPQPKSMYKHFFPRGAQPLGWINQCIAVSVPNPDKYGILGQEGIQVKKKTLPDQFFIYCSFNIMFYQVIFMTENGCPPLKFNQYTHHIKHSHGEFGIINFQFQFLIVLLPMKPLLIIPTATKR